MAKAILEFDLSDPDDRADHQKSVKATDAFLALWDISQLFRKQLKYGDLDQATYNKIEAMSEDFYDTLNQYGISMNMIE
jgi:hypothetical protein